MTRHITIDFETRSSTDIRYGAHRYAQDPNTTVMCIAFLLPEDTEPRIWYPAYPAAGIEEEGANDLDLLLAEVASGTLIEAHNAGFERAIWDYICAPRMGWPKVKPSQWRCSAATAASFALPRSLDGASQALLDDVNKDKAGHKIMMKVSKPRATLKADLEPIAEREGVAWKDLNATKTIFKLREQFPQHSDLTSKMNPWHEKENELLALFSYCKQDVRVERAISDALPGPLSPKEMKVWQMDQEMNFRGVALDMGLVDAAIATAEDCKDAANIRIAELTDGLITSIGQRAKFITWINEQPGDHTIENAQKATIAEAVDHPEWWTPEAHEALRLRQSVSKTSTKKYDTMAKAVCNDSRVRGLLAYHGADTGRWAGRIVQPQNFPRGTVKESIENLCDAVLEHDRETLELLYGDAMEVLSSALRGAVVSSVGKDLICADYSAIEARGVFWLSGDVRALDVFRSGKDIYKDMATTVYGVDYADVTAEQRQMGKQAILGLGYQMGAEKFQETCMGYGMEVDIDEAKRIVTAYRESHHPVKSLWYNLQTAVFEALQNGRREYGQEVVMLGGRLKVIHTMSDYLQIILPSGRAISFYKPQLKELYNERFERMETKITFMGVNSMTRKYTRLETYGGKLVENVVQGLSRDIMAEAMLAIDEHPDYTPILTVHDEIVAEVPEGRGSVTDFEDLIAVVPDWAKGFPLAAEGWRGKRYRK